jgi:transmembrane sensor
MIGWFAGFGRERRMRALAREASGWLASDPESNDETRAAFAAWLLRSPQHVQIWLELTAFDEEAGQRLGFPRFGSIMATVAASNTRLTPRAPIYRPRSVERWQHALPICGVALLVLGAAVIATWLWHRKPDHYAAALGEHRTLALEDGSTLQINTQSQVDVVFSRKARQVRLLSGEAMLDVWHDVERPFDVHAECGNFRALGTSFLVRLVSSNRCQLLVTSGTVQVSPAYRGRALHGIALVDAGEQADVGPAGIAVRGASEHEIARRLAWLRGQLWFENETLEEAVAQFNRYNAEELVIDDPQLAGMRVGGAFRATDVKRFVNALEKVFGVHAETVRTWAGSGAEIHLTVEAASTSQERR